MTVWRPWRVRDTLTLARAHLEDELAYRPVVRARAVVAHERLHRARQPGRRHTRTRARRHIDTQTHARAHAHTSSILCSTGSSTCKAIGYILISFFVHSFYVAYYLTKAV